MDICIIQMWLQEFPRPIQAGVTKYHSNVFLTAQEAEVWSRSTNRVEFW
jgi:hypothetical protein